MTRGGRPRDPELDGKVLRAAVTVLADKGYPAMRIDDVAREAGVPKSSIYRRWPSVRHLVLDAMETAVGPRDLVGTGDPWEDLQRLTRSAAHGIVDGPFGATVFHVGAQLVGDPDLGPDYRARLIDPIRERVVALIEECQARGIVRADVDARMTFDQLVGLVLYRHLVLHEPLAGADLDAGLDRILAQLRA